MTTPSYFYYWGKAKKDLQQEGPDYHLLPYHSLDVAAVGYLLLSPSGRLCQLLAEFLGLKPEFLQTLFAFILSLHDLGKFVSAFQALYPNDFEGLITPASRSSYNGETHRHDRMGWLIWKKIQRDGGFHFFGLGQLENGQRKDVTESLEILLCCSFGHHGQPVDSGKASSMNHFSEPHNIQSIIDFAHKMAELFAVELPIELFTAKEWRKKLKQVSWDLAGVAVLADWIGSDRNYFRYQTEVQALESYWEKSRHIAQNALAAIGLHKAPEIRPFLSIQEHYGFEPSPLQRWAESVAIDSSPQLFILEEATGAGKTEAALALTHRLMEAGAAEGFYFGLPTMATSNAMFERVAKHYRQMLGDPEHIPSIVLAHGAREMHETFREFLVPSTATDSNYSADDATATAQCQQWFSDSRKKALLALVGVGTIDQALLAVLPRRHQSLRLLGLNRKVLIFDEVHAADHFMFELLESLLSLHLHHGGSAILLTATLSQQQRTKLCRIWQQASDAPTQLPRESAFPLATKVSALAASSLTVPPLTTAPLKEYPLESRSDRRRELVVNFLHSVDACVSHILSAVDAGQCVVWVRNSVDDALAAYHLLQVRMSSPENCQLFHSRFILHDRKRIENTVLQTYGKQSDKGLRQGKVLIATQVFQESLDADVDMMISDICPIDDLIQRAGRLHRHSRDQRGKYRANINDYRKPPVLWVHAPEWSDTPSTAWLSQQFQNTQYVYRSPGRLWLAMKMLRELGAIRIPQEARELIESVYSDQAYDNMPEALQGLEDEFFGDERNKAHKAQSQLIRWQSGYSQGSHRYWSESNSDISTRYSDRETVEVLLLKEQNGQLVPWVDAEKFSIPLSTVKVAKQKYADRLQSMPEHLKEAEEQLKRRFPSVHYLQCWLPDSDPHFAYTFNNGFHQRIEQEAL